MPATLFAKLFSAICTILIVLIHRRPWISSSAVGDDPVLPPLHWEPILLLLIVDNKTLWRIIYFICDRRPLVLGGVHTLSWAHSIRQSPAAAHHRLHLKSGICADLCAANELARLLLALPFFSCTSASLSSSISIRQRRSVPGLSGCYRADSRSTQPSAGALSSQCQVYGLHVICVKTIQTAWVGPPTA